MKKIIVILFAIALLPLVSCKKWLEEQSTSQYMLDDFFKNTDELNASLTGVYGTLTNFYNNSCLGPTVLGTDEILTTALGLAWGPIDQYLFAPGNPNIQSWYTQHFRAIQQANLVIKYAPSVPDLLPADSARIIGEARFLRAWVYFRLVQAFGRVPLVLDETTDYDFYVRRDSIAKIYRAVIDDLKYASADGVLPDKKNFGRVNHWAAKGMLAKVYLTLGTSMIRRPQPIDEYRQLPWNPTELFSQCKALCDDIMARGGFALEPKYGDVFIIANKNINKESIWEIQFSKEPGMGSQWSKQHGVYGAGGDNAGATNMLHTINAMIGTSQYKCVPSFFRTFRVGDYRRTWSISDYDVQYIADYKPNPIPDNIVKNMISSQKVETGEFANPDTNDPVLLEKVLTNRIVTNWFGISKYRWGKGPDPDLWYKEEMDYDYANCPNNVIVLRYADIIMMDIEADMLLNGGKPSARALQLMNEQIVARARSDREGNKISQEALYTQYIAPLDQAILDSSTPAAMADAQLERDRMSDRMLFDYNSTVFGHPTADLTYDELMRQRACEFCFEFQRWFDLVRTGTLVDAVKARKANPAIAPPPAISFPKHYLFPIPQSEIDMARDKENFKQNPDY